LLHRSYIHGDRCRGLHRITENTIAEAIRLSNLEVENWFALKEYSDNNRPYVHLYVE
jgi:hypothetical protein